MPTQFLGKLVRISIAERALLESLSKALKGIGEIHEEEILRTVRAYRKEKRAKTTVASKTH